MTSADPPNAKSKTLSRLPKASNCNTNTRTASFQANSIDWLTSLDDSSVNLVFADPPYKIKKADWDSFESQEHYIEWSPVD